MSGLDQQHSVCIPVSYSFDDDTIEALGTAALGQGHILLKQQPCKVMLGCLDMQSTHNSFPASVKLWGERG